MAQWGQKTQNGLGTFTTVFKIKLRTSPMRDTGW